MDNYYAMSELIQQPNNNKASFHLKRVALITPATLFGAFALLS